MINKEMIRNNFSKYARIYDHYAAVQNLVAADLIEKRNLNGFKQAKKILDLGCGTGNFTSLLRKRFPCAKLKAVDISRDMIKVSRNKLKSNNIEFITADAEQINFKERFDLISSNAAFQWFEDLGEALKKYAGWLNKNGLMLFSIFGPRTFFELAECLKVFSKRSLKITASGFLDKAAIELLLKNIFKEIKIEEKIYQETHSSLRKLLEKIKYTGTRGSLQTNFWTQNKISVVEEIYLKNFKVISATYQVYFCRGLK